MYILKEKDVKMEFGECGVIFEILNNIKVWELYK